MKPTPEQLDETLRLHRIWSRDGDGGVRANLTDADLRDAYLTQANLTWANLDGAKLSGANLASVRGVRCVAITADWHGKSGRQILAVDHGEEGVIIHCGCFRGGWDDLDRWIEEHDECDRVTASRRAVATTLRTLWDAREDYECR